jgi:UDP-GlcNAc3NAcA epimerase
VKICTVVGARPQFIKAAAVSRAIQKESGITEVLIHTGQHYDANMSGQFFEELHIPHPSYQLNIGSSSHGVQTGQMLGAVEAVLQEELPDWVLVYGDTNSTLAGALAAAKLHIPVAHVEAGLRSFNRTMPEEINRITADHLSQVLFAPTTTSYQRLLKEGIDAGQVFQVGDVMYDTTKYYNQFNKNRHTIVTELDLKTNDYVLVTIHRAENTDQELRLINICHALIELAGVRQVILPLHPRTKGALAKIGLLERMQEHITLIPPVGYLDMLALEQYAYCIVTDSGGVQKEAYFNQVPCITLRDETEWVELVAAFWNQLCPPNLPFSLIELVNSAKSLAQQTEQSDLYGQGDTAERIVGVLKNYNNVWRPLGRHETAARRSHETTT